ncbi:phosphate ABC transporter permease PstA [Nocardia puris]|nr:phosphate ABC transporter permease PstA [Nocardia puris]MBF6211777.1 phosphate ABC transporter permease PstA [Nocardia puris]MBF6365780.1 phosphate ABC transporter permease PstA [Nocardia puris]MBF6460577.1 phosphate ABC transporter permease PstA [Nocardia puris]
MTKFDAPVKAPTFRHVSTGRRIRNHLATGLVTLCFVIALIPLGWVLWMVISKGIGAILTSEWWLNSQRGILPDQTGGGVYHAIYGTVVQSAVAAVLAVPLGIMAAVYLVEYGRGRLARVTTFMVDILAGVPSIVAALFIFALWIATLGFPQSSFAVSLALVLLMLPVVVRSTEEMLKLVPDELREASYALGIPKWKTIMRIVIPTALPGMISGILLALARVMGETAPVLVLVGYSKSINTDLFDGNMASLPLMIYQELANPEAAGRERVWGAALTLILLIALLYVAAAGVNKLLTRNR